MWIESTILPANGSFQAAPMWIPAPASGGDPYITSLSSTGAPRNDYGDGVGFAFTVGALNIVVTDVGRWILAGNSQSHTVSIYSGTNTATDLVATGSIDTSMFSAGVFGFSSLAAPVTLSAGGTYYIESFENSGGDAWYNDGGTVPVVALDASLVGSTYISGGIINMNTPGVAFVPPNFKYHL